MLAEKGKGRIMNMRKMLGMVIAGMVLSLINAASAAVSYTVVDLGTLPGDATSYARGINSYGDAAGTCAPVSISSVPEQAFFFSNGVMQGLGTLPGYGASFGSRVNDSKQVAGFSYKVENYLSQAFLWTNGVMVPLGVLPGDTCSIGNGLNNKGQVVGYSRKDLASQQFRAFLFSGGTMTELGDGLAYAINDLSEVVGQSGARVARVWKGGSFQDLGKFGYTWSNATDINIGGRIVGEAYTSALSAVN